MISALNSVPWSTHREASSSGVVDISQYADTGLQMASFMHSIGSRVMKISPMSTWMPLETKWLTAKIRENSSKIAALVVKTDGMYNALPIYIHFAV